MKSINNISEEQRMLITVIIASIPRRTLQEFKESISELNSEELNYLKHELSMLVVRGDRKYWDAYHSL